MKLNSEEEVKKIIENIDRQEFFKDICSKYIRTNSKFVRDILDNLMAYSEENNDVRIKGWTYYYFGYYYLYLSEYESAIDKFFLAKEIFESVYFYEGAIFIYNSLARVYCEIGQFKLSNEWTLAGISLGDKSNIKEFFKKFLMDSCINHIRMKYFERAKEIYDTIGEIDVELKSSHKIVHELVLAEIEIYIGDPTKALDRIEDALKLELDLGFNIVIPKIYRLKGVAYTKLGDFENAQRQFAISYEYALKYDAKYDRCVTAIEWAELLFTCNKIQDSIEKLKDAIQISEEKNIKILAKQAYYLLYLCKKQKNDLINAIDHLEKYVSINSDLYDYEKDYILAKSNIKNIKREDYLYKVFYDRTEYLSCVGQVIITNLDMDSLIQTLLLEINNLMKVDKFGIALYNENCELEYCKTKIIDSKIIDKKIYEESLEYSCVKNKWDILVKDIKQECKFVDVSLFDEIEETNKVSSMIYVPLILKGKVSGVITVQSYKENQYDQDDLYTIKILSGYASIAVYNASSYKKVEHRATYDYLTGFLTKEEILKLGQILYNKCRTKLMDVSVIMIDIDNFKEVNDKYGHVIGDKVLKMITNEIFKFIRNTDYIGRYGGDEFLLLCTGTTLKEAINIAERIRMSIFNKKFILKNGIKIEVTTSLGVHKIDPNDGCFLNSVESADKCMYKSKNESKNRVYANFVKV